MGAECSGCVSSCMTKEEGEVGPLIFCEIIMVRNPSDQRGDSELKINK